MMIQSNINFETNTPIVSKTFFNAQSDLMAIHVSGDFTSAEIAVEGRIFTDSPWVPLAALDATTFNLNKGTITKAGLYNIDIAGVRAFRFNIKSVGGGNLDITGQTLSLEEA